ncbi:F-BAR and double SH3 domains protein 1 [Podochytrium sp. JEL0797]|nr:F-BAR and double SH3 domains protein 1 [Podochytrium sp. JEL0797]
MATRQVRTKLQQQLSKLQTRAEANLELLADLRTFMKEKAKLDEDYAKGLDKLSKSLQSKKFKRGPTLSTNLGKTSTLFPSASKLRDSKSTSASGGSLNNHTTPDDVEYYVNDDGSTVRAAYTTYLALILSSERIAKTRSTASERTANEISEFLKDYTKDRTGSLKKTMDFAIRYQHELFASFDDLDKTKSTYERTSKETESAKRKYEETAKKPNSGFNVIKNAVSRMDGEERVEMLRQKWKSLEVRLTESRNDYLLAISAVNSQQSRYSSHDLSTWMKKFDTDFHDTFRTLFATYTDLESRVAAEIGEGVGKVRAAVEKVDGKADTEAFVFDNTQLFVDPPKFGFEAYPGDGERVLVVDDTTQTPLGLKLSHLRSQMGELSSTLGKKQVEYEGIKQLASAYTTTPQFGNPSGSFDQMAEVENAMDLIQCVQSRISAQIAMLEEANVVAVSAVENAEGAGNGSVGGVSPPRGALTIAATRNFVTQYGYDAQADGELSISEGEELEALGEELNGWIQVQSKRTNTQGLVPFNYIKEIIHPASLFSASLSRPTSTLPSTRSESPSITSRPVSMAAAAVVGGGGGGGDRVQALYDYVATCAGELSFSAGEIVVVTNRNTGSSAWWEGEGKKGKGQFPVNYVKALEEGKTFKVKALYDYTGADSGELSFHVNDEIEVLEAGDADWWMGRLGGKEGLVPASYVARV